jgi:hypothetical protein
VSDEPNLPANPFEPPTSDFPGVENPGEKLVANLATKSVVCGAVGILCCGVIFGPIALSYANRAEAALISMDAGHGHTSTIKIGRVLGYVAIAFWALGVIVQIGGLLAR